MIDVYFEDLPKSSWEAKANYIAALRKNGDHVHLIYDRRITRTRRPIAENKYLIYSGVIHLCRQVSIINGNGANDVIKEARHG